MKKGVFYFITFLTPVVLLIFIELLLRALNYGSPPQPLFIEDPIDAEYLTLNPRVGERYFNEDQYVTGPQYEIMKYVKGDSTFRVFVQGASSSAGFPYHNASFPKLLEQRLIEEYPSLDIEVINTSIVATNSYTMLDLADEIIDAQPDLVIVYGGHNEYYGALGVASTQSRGSSPIFVNAYLSLKKYRLTQLISNGIQSIKGKREYDGSQTTLMAKMIRKDTISLGSELYKNGLKQYEFNISRLIDKYHKAGITVKISSLASNMSGFRPFLSSNEDESALKVFEEAQVALGQGDVGKARYLFHRAKDLDLLKFRAPSDIDSIINDLSQTKNVEVLDIRSAFEDESAFRLIGNELMHEHVHPNLKGQRIMANVAFEAVAKTIEEKLGLFPIGVKDFKYAIAPADSLYAELLIEQLMIDWPFNRGEESDRLEMQSKAAQVIAGTIPWQQVLLESYYEQLGSQPQLVLQTAKVMLNDAPHQEEGYLLVANAYMKLGDFEMVEQLLTNMPEKLQTDKVLILRQKNAITGNQYTLAIELTEKLLLSKPRDFTLTNQLASCKAISIVNQLNREGQEVPEKLQLDALEAYIFLEKKEEAYELLNNINRMVYSSDRLKALERRLRQM